MGLARGDVDHVPRPDRDRLLELVTPLDLEPAGQHVDGALAGLVVVGPRLGARRHAEDAHVDVRGPGRRLRDLVAADDAPRGVAILALSLDDLHAAQTNARP